MISITNLNKSFGSQVLFKDASLILNKGEKLGLIGKNGYGKTTLFKIIVGEETSDDLNIVIPKNYKISYLKQNLVFTKDTVLKECLLALDTSEETWKAEKILFGLGFKDLINLHPSQLSGGFQIRLNLAKLLLTKSNMLLLDEPNNYLDINSLIWLSGFLKNFAGEIILVTHDRAFMDSVITHVAGINRQKIKKITGNTGKYYELVEQEETIHEKTRLNQEKKIKQTTEFINKFRAKARQANMVQSRIKTLEKNQPLEKLSQAKSLNFKFKEASFTGNYALNIKNLNFGFTDENKLITDLSITALYGDKICVIGKNGKGKTTLLKIIKGLIKPEGQISISPNTIFGYYEQTNVSSLNPELSVLDEVAYSSINTDMQTIRNICGTMMFEGDSALKKIGVLSGGEKCRVLLAKILATPCNFLLLDEPTNHLDMDSCNSFLNALKVFKGTVIIVTHNEYFLKELAQKLIVFKNNESLFFDGDYEYFLEKIGWDDQIQIKSKNKKNIKNEKAKFIQNRSKILSPIKQKISKLENEINILEKNLSLLNEDLLKASISKNGQLISSISIEINSIVKKLDALYVNLEPLVNEYDNLEKDFEEKQKKLEIDLEL